LEKLISLIVQKQTEQTNLKLLGSNKSFPKTLPPAYTRRRTKNNPAL